MICSGDLDPVAAHQRADGLPRLVHERDRERQHDPFVAVGAREPGLGDQCVVAAALHRRATTFGEQPDCFLADVVARAGVLLARIAEPDDQPVVRLAFADAPEQPHHRAPT